MQIVVAVILIAVQAATALADSAGVPKTVEALWSDFDPRNEPLDVQVVREWDEDGIHFRYVTFRIGILKGKSARMAAFYAFPKDGKKLPALLHMHGGGQR